MSVLRRFTEQLNILTVSWQSRNDIHKSLFTAVRLCESLSRSLSLSLSLSVFVCVCVCVCVCVYVCVVCGWGRVRSCPHLQRVQASVLSVLRSCLQAIVHAHELKSENLTAPAPARIEIAPQRTQVCVNVVATY